MSKVRGFKRKLNNLGKGYSAVSIILSITVVFSGIGFFGVDDANALIATGQPRTNTSPLVKTETIPGTSIKASINGAVLTVSGNGAIPANTFATDGLFGSNLKDVTKIVIDGGITEIGIGAFSGCVNLTNLTFNSNVTKLKLIRLAAFYKCTKLGKVTIPKSVTHVQDLSFNHTKTALIVLNPKMQKYGNNGYRCYDNLTVNVARKYTLAYDMLSQINTYRKNNGLTNLTMDRNLIEVSMERAVEIITQFSHTRPNGEEFSTIWGGVHGEVIGRGGTTAKDMFNTMVKNAANKSTILNNGKKTTYKAVGVGCIQYNGVYYWVLCFGQKLYSGMSKEAAPGDFTAKSNLELPVGTNVINVDGKTYTHKFSFNTSKLKLLKGQTYNASLKLGVLDFIKSGVKWSTTNSSVAKVSSTGVISAIGAGTAQIKAGSTLTNRVSLNVTVTSMGRLAGIDRLATAFKIAEAYKKSSGQSKLKNVILVYGMNFPDALSASYLSTKYNAPVIMTSGTPNGDKNAVNWVKKNMSKNGGKVYFVGGTSVLPNSIKKQFDKAGYTVGRVYGNDRLGTNLAVLKHVGVPNGSEVLVCDGFNFHNPLIASATGKPMLMVKPSGLTKDQISFFKNKNCKFTIIGDKKSVPVAVENDLKNIGAVTRLSKSNPDAMSVAVASRYWPNGPKRAFVATSTNFPDALAGGPECILFKSPLFLVSEKSYTNTRDYLKKHDLTTITAFGGTVVVPDSLLKKAGGF